MKTPFRNAYALLLGVLPVLLLFSNLRADENDRQSHVNFKLNGIIKKITDGDSVTLEGRNNKRFTIRLSDIDTPEIHHDAFTPRNCNECKMVPARAGQPGGKAATQALKNLLDVGDKVVAECYETDIYKRMVCHLFKGGTNINLEMIKSGWGWLLRNKQGKLISAWIQDSASYDAERVARQNMLGAWGLPAQVSPRQWRINCWGNGNCEGEEK